MQAVRDIPVGTILEKDLFKSTIISKDEINENEEFVNYDELINKRARINITTQDYLTKSLLIDSNIWYEEGDRLVEHIFAEGIIPELNDNLVGTLVDIILFKKGAVDEIVVSKVAIIAANENRLSFYLNETECEYLKEASSEEGGFYLRAYLNDNQTASLITYEPKYN